MNWDAIGAVGEIVGASAVVVSLIYLAVQVKAQNREARVASAHDIFEAFRNIALPFQNPDHAALMAKSMHEGYNNLTETERIQVIAVVIPMLRVWEEAYYQHRSERLELSIWSSISAQYIDMLSLSQFQEVWCLRKHIFSEEFRRYVDSIEAGSTGILRVQPHTSRHLTSRWRQTLDSVLPALPLPSGAVQAPLNSVLGG